ncbi:MAG: hypothetical protein KDM91_13415 [Verrucomicrobiae bacterium]|nr:hypothetical protein [Verrucomicrobiae bacterium]MCP5539843.1 hypothetical protein [Akkermansiaceae bacterium]MCP5551934.1 hypothetical protein [Akkermansiaceae bacterium]
MNGFLFNRVEAWLWFAVAASLLVRGWRTDRQRTVHLIAGILFAVFGTSDLIEARTGAWWTPWWLAVWKAACLAGIAWALAHLIRGSRRSG